MVVLGARKERSLTCANTEADGWQHRPALGWSQVAASPGWPHLVDLTWLISLGWPHLAGGAVGAGASAAKLPNTMSGAEAL